jgi:hypothetical protein
MEGKQRTASQSRLIGTWPTTGDGGRVDEFFHAWADEGDAEQVAVIVVGDHAGPAGAAVGVQAGPGHRLAGADVDHADAVPGAFGLVGEGSLIRAPIRGRDAAERGWPASRAGPAGSRAWTRRSLHDSARQPHLGRGGHRWLRVPASMSHPRHSTVGRRPECGRNAIAGQNHLA